MNSNLRSPLTEFNNLDMYQTLTYTPKFLQLVGQNKIYPQLTDARYVNTVPYTSIDDIKFKTLLPSGTELSQMVAERKVHPAYIQELETVEYNEGVYQRSVEGEVTRKAIRKGNILYDQAMWFGDSLGNVGFLNNVFTTTTDLGTLTTPQALYEAIITAYVTFGNNLQADNSNTCIVIPSSVMAILLVPAGNNLELSSYYSRLRNEILPNPDQLIVIPDFIFTNMGGNSNFFAIIEKELIMAHSTLPPHVVLSGELKLNRFWIFGFYTVMIDVLEEGAVAIYTFTPSMVALTKKAPKESN